MDNFALSGARITRSEIFQMILRVSVASLVTFYSIKWMLEHIDPTNKTKKKAKLRAEQLLKRLHYTELCNLLV